jgi:cyclohexyl-isocyanide hydratase
MSALKVGIPLYTNFDSLDVIGPYQTFTYAGMDLYLVAATHDLVTSFEGVSILPRATFTEQPPSDKYPQIDVCPQLDMLFVPGGSDPVSVLEVGYPGNNPYLDFLIRQAPGCRLVCSVCTGALLLAGAGLLNGHIVTTHWAFKDVLRLFPVKVVDDYRRYVQSGNRVTGAGISSGLDLALYIVSLVCNVGVARQGQLAMQYNPQPAFHCGDPDDTDIKDDPQMVSERMKEWHVEQARISVKQWIEQQS